MRIHGLFIYIYIYNRRFLAAFTSRFHVQAPWHPEAPSLFLQWSTLWTLPNVSRLFRGIRRWLAGAGPQGHFQRGPLSPLASALLWGPGQQPAQQRRGPSGQALGLRRGKSHSPWTVSQDSGLHSHRHQKWRMGVLGSAQPLQACTPSHRPRTASYQAYQPLGQDKGQTCRQQLTNSRMRPTSRCHMPRSMGGSVP